MLRGGPASGLESHAIIELSNRIITGLLGVAVIAAAVLAFFRRPYRRHLAIFGALLPLGVIAQAILGALVVKYDLRPELVMGHFILSMMLLDAGFALFWCARYEPWDRRRSWDRKGVWAVRALVPLGQLTILAGTIATGSGPHAGEFEGQLVQRFTFEGDDTLEWVVQRHAVLAAVYGFAAIGVWFFLRRPGGDRRAIKPLTMVLLLLLSRESSATSSGSSNCRPRSSGSTSPSPPATGWRCCGRSPRRGGSSRARAPCRGARSEAPSDRVGLAPAGAGAGAA